MFNRERVILTIEPKAIRWYRGIVLYGSLAYLTPNSLNALTLGAICVRQSAYRSNDELFHYTLGERDTDPDRRRSSIVCEG